MISGQSECPGLLLFGFQCHGYSLIYRWSGGEARLGPSVNVVVAGLVV